jgi:hypothetical protein
MEISILIPWYRAHLINANTNALTIFLTLFGFTLIAMYTSRYLQANENLSGFHWIGLLIVLLLGLYGFLRSVVFTGLGLSMIQVISRTISSFAGENGEVPLSILTILSVLYLWWRGIAAAGMGNLEFIGTRRRFRFGIITFGVFALVHQIPEINYLIDVLPIFFISGLIAINLGKTHRLSQRKAAFQLPFTGRWFFGIMTITVITILVGLLGAAFLQTNLARDIAEFVSDLLLRGFQALILMISPFFLWVLPLAEKLLAFLESLEVGLTPEELEGGFIITRETTFENEGEGRLYIPNELIIGVVIILILIFVIIIVDWTRLGNLVSVGRCLLRQ